MTSDRSEVIFHDFAFDFVTSWSSSSQKKATEPDHSQLILKQASSSLVSLLKRCNPAFHYSSSLNPRRILTKPSEGVANNNWDNVGADYILRVNDLLFSPQGHRYQVLDLLGEGTFGQVVKCLRLDTKELVAVKIVKNRPAYFNQAIVEIRILQLLNRHYDPEDKHHHVRLLDYFSFRNHLCLVCELLNLNLYELLKQNQFRGLSSKLVRQFLNQILDALSILADARIIHCDMKPENIVLKNLTSPTIKLIDFGSACFENQTVYMYIQSRFYRAPEVLLGLPYSSAIDIWSLGCIAAELFLGLPLFPGSSEFNQICRIVEMLGNPPPGMLDGGKATSDFFKKVDDGGVSTWRLKTDEEYATENNLKLEKPKKYFNFNTLDDIIEKYALKKSLNQQQIEQEKGARKALVHFLKGVLHLDPSKRWTAEEALQHPFVAGTKFEVEWAPPQRSPRVERQLAGAERDGEPLGAARSKPQAIMRERPMGRPLGQHPHPRAASLGAQPVEALSEFHNASMSMAQRWWTDGQSAPLNDPAFTLAHSPSDASPNMFAFPPDSLMANAHPQHQAQAHARQHQARYYDHHHFAMALHSSVTGTGSGAHHAVLHSLSLPTEPSTTLGMTADGAADSPHVGRSVTPTRMHFGMGSSATPGARYVIPGPQSNYLVPQLPFASPYPSPPASQLMTPPARVSNALQQFILASASANTMPRSSASLPASVHTAPASSSSSGLVSSPVSLGPSLSAVAGQPPLPQLHLRASSGEPPSPSSGGMLGSSPRTQAQAHAMQQVHMHQQQLLYQHHQQQQQYRRHASYAAPRRMTVAAVGEVAANHLGP